MSTLVPPPHGRAVLGESQTLSTAFSRLTVKFGFEDSDVPAMSRIENRCFDKNNRWSEAYFRRYARKENNFWVALIGNDIAGFLAARMVKAVPSIATIDIDPDYQKQGIGTILMDRVERAFCDLGYKEIRLETGTDNRAQIMYFNRGYRVSGFLKDYYAKQRNAVEMRKKF